MADTKLVWNPDNVRDVAESVGISALNEEAVRALSQEVEYRVGQVIVEAMRFMQLGKRTVLGTQDIAQALRVLDVEPLFGYESTRPLRFGEASLGPGQPLYYIEDEEVDFEKLINAPLPKVPRDTTFTAHWLAVEGVQPTIPQNPTTAESRASELLPKGPSANPTLAALAGNDGVAFKPQVKHVISKELMLYFEKIKNAIIDEDNEDEEVIRLRETALASVRDEQGLHQLVPYFVQFISEKVTHSLKNTFVLRQMMELSSALISNESLHIDPYVNPLCAPVLTCLVTRRLGSSDSHDEINAQYQLREFAASLIGNIAKKFGKSSLQLKPRLARTLLKTFLDPTKSLPVHYGAICGLTAVTGSEGARQLIVPNLKFWDMILVKGQNEGGEHNFDVDMVIGALLQSLQLLSDSDLSIMNGTGMTDHSQELEAKLGPIMGARVAALNDPKLTHAILGVKGLGD